MIHTLDSNLSQVWEYEIWLQRRYLPFFCARTANVKTFWMQTCRIEVKRADVWPNVRRNFKAYFILTGWYIVIVSIIHKHQVSFLKWSIVSEPEFCQSCSLQDGDFTGKPLGQEPNQWGVSPCFLVAMIPEIRQGKGCKSSPILEMFLCSRLQSDFRLTWSIQQKTVGLAESCPQLHRWSPPSPSAHWPSACSLSATREEYILNGLSIGERLKSIFLESELAFIAALMQVIKMLYFTWSGPYFTPSELVSGPLSFAASENPNCSQRLW